MGNIEAKLFRVRPLEIVPDNQDYQYDLAIISSIRHIKPEKLIWYWQHLIQAFGETANKVQVVLADNTPNNRWQSLLESLNQIAPPNLKLQSLHQSRPGQIHGLNTALKEARSQLIMKVDITDDKEPAEGTLLNLFLRIKKDPSLALLSSIVLFDFVNDNPTQRSLGNATRKQYWNEGIAYIFRRDLHFGWNPSFVEDYYTYRIIVSQKGKFEIADLQVHRRRPTTLAGQAKQTARHITGDLQLDTLTLEAKDGHQIPLSKYRYIIPPEPSAVNRLFQQVCSLSKDQLFGIPAIIFFKAIRRYLLMPHYLAYYKKQLSDDPDFCAW